MDAKFSLTSWSIEEDPKQGNFTFKKDPQGRKQLVVPEKSTVYWRSSWLDSSHIIKSDELPSTIVEFLGFYQGDTQDQDKKINKSGELSSATVNFMNFSQGHTQVYQDKRMVINSTGYLQYWQLGADNRSWSLIWWEPNNVCSKFNFCGNFGTCTGNSRLPCKCLPGFEPKCLEKWNAGDFLDGCSRNYTSSSGNDFLSLKRMEVEDSDSSCEERDEIECREECLKKSKCRAYSFVGQRDTTTSCLIWSGDLENLQEGQDGGYDLHVRVARSDIGTSFCTNEQWKKYSTWIYCLFYFAETTDELSFMAPNVNYSVVTVDCHTRTFIIQMKTEEEDNCSAMHSLASRILQFDQSSPFNVISNCRGDVGNLTTSDSSLYGTVDIKISWSHRWSQSVLLQTARTGRIQPVTKQEMDQDGAVVTVFRLGTNFLLGGKIDVNKWFLK
ncbi:hypothetical protein F3Y22_tig00111493pilonHSYRG00183 [Hibiscus syriacus]|uniref:Apple domain-containing protein n=1 Tax=Hibiscus syriacus TaxID=106335 RepID=A0A6A2YJU8_HIBSY|nr:hypothetical protein F3Y22_tig00111493pilonHSYRG00183 [Hibiscus syriacus]